MIVVAILLASASANQTQVLSSPSFEAFARRAGAVCPSRRLRFVTPADLELTQDEFLRSHARERRAAANLSKERCMHSPGGLSCLATATLDAFVRTGQLREFVAYACRHPAPR